ncbi:MAG: DMT family transporter [Owenweeksia sp.]
MRLSNSNPYVRLHFIVFIYGFTGILGKLISLNALELVWHRMWIAAVCILGYLAATGKLRFDLARKSGKIILAGALIAAHWITFFHAIKISTVPVALSCLATGAFFGSLIEPLVYKRKIRGTEIVMGLLVVMGLYLIFRFEGQYTAGIITALISAFLSACFSVLNSKLVQSNAPYRITFLEMLGGWIAISLYMLIVRPENLSLWSLEAMDWLYLILLGSICTAYAFIENVGLMRNISAYTFLLTINLEPVYGILLALLFFEEGRNLDPFFFAGTGIILSTLFLDALLRKRLSKRGVV